MSGRSCDESLLEADEATDQKSRTLVRDDGDITSYEPEEETA